MKVVSNTKLISCDVTRHMLSAYEKPSLPPHLWMAPNLWMAPQAYQGSRIIESCGDNQRPNIRRLVL